MKLSSLSLIILTFLCTGNLIGQTNLNKLSAVTISTQSAASVISDHSYTESSAFSLKQISDLITYKFNYPADMRMYGIEGTSTVSFNISNEGRVENLVILESLGAAFDYEIKQVFKTVKNVSPIQVNGKAISQKIILPIHFEL